MNALKILYKDLAIVLTICLLILLLCNQTRAADFLCLHYKGDPLTPVTCQFLHDKFGFDSKLYADYAGKKYSIIWLAAFGTPDGFWADPEGKHRIPWNTIVGKYKAAILIVEACYSGQVFRYKIPKGITVITSTNESSVSVNTPEEWSDWNYLPTLASMFYCFYSEDPTCKKYVGCSRSNFDPQVCQMSIILHSCAERGYRNTLLNSVQEWPEDHPNFSIGTVMINGKSWRQIK